MSLKNNSHLLKIYGTTILMLFVLYWELTLIHLEKDSDNHLYI